MDLRACNGFRNAYERDLDALPAGTETPETEPDGVILWGCYRLEPHYNGAPDRSFTWSSGKPVRAGMVARPTNTARWDVYFQREDQADYWNAPFRRTGSSEPSSNFTPAWQPAPASYNVGDVIRPTAGNKHKYRCTNAGAALQPVAARRATRWTTPAREIRLLSAAPPAASPRPR